LNLQTWINPLTWKTLLFKTDLMHDTVMGLFVDKVELGVDIHAKLQVKPAT
jgi:insertion element IS1 protein InsB